MRRAQWIGVSEARLDPFSVSAYGRPSRHSELKELRVEVAGEPYRVLFAFDPERSAVILLGGCKRGDKRWYERMIPIAEARFQRHLQTLNRRGE
jgi:hypothetical protein